MEDVRTLFRVAEIDPSIPAVDVHGMRLEEAKYAIDFFIDRLVREKSRIGKIIHGKGEEILARILPKYIEKHEFVESTHMPGGTYETGAVIYVSIIL